MMNHKRRDAQTTLEIWWKLVVVSIIFTQLLLLLFYYPPSPSPLQVQTQHFKSIPPSSSPSSLPPPPTVKIDVQNNNVIDHSTPPLLTTEELLSPLLLQLNQTKQQREEEQQLNYDLVMSLINKQSQLISALKYQTKLLSQKKQVVPTTIVYSHQHYKEDLLPKLNIVSFNVWNTNGEWKDRLSAFASQLHVKPNLQLDIIAFQEVRTYDTSHTTRPIPLYTVYQIGREVKGVENIMGTEEYKEFEYPKTQLHYLQSLFPEFPYLIFVAFTTFTSPPNQQEGIAIISKHPIIQASTLNISNGGKGPGYSDTNSRGILHCSVLIPSFPGGDVRVEVYNTHLPYVQVQQCNSVKQLYQYIVDTSFTSPSIAPSLVVIMGDMNTYFDYEWPMEILTSQNNWLLTHPTNPCSSELKLSLQANPNFFSNKLIFTDVWNDEIKRMENDQKMPLATKEDLWAGHTFPSFQPTSGYLNNCRPDRMFYWNNVDANSDALLPANNSNNGGSNGGGNGRRDASPPPPPLFGNLRVYLLGGEYSPKQFMSDHAGILASFYLLS